MPLLDAPAVAKLLVEIGQRLSLAGENPYKARSYSRAAQSLMSLTVPLQEVIASDRLREIPGVGAALAETIKNLHQHGTTTKLEAMRAELPPACSRYRVFQAFQRTRSCRFIGSSASRASRIWSRP